MTYSTIDELASTFRASLQDKLKRVVAPLTAYHQAAGNLTAVGVEVSSTKSSEVVAQCICGFLKQLEDSLTRDYAGNGTVRVAFKSKERLGRTFYRNAIDVERFFGKAENLNDALHAVLDHYPFRDLAESALKQCATLEARGLEDAADRLASMLHLVDHGNGSNIKTQRNRVISYLSLRSSFDADYSWEDPRDLQEIAKLFRVVEEEMGDLGASRAFEECADILNNAPQRFPSRTKLLEGRPVDFVVFNHHMDIRINADVSDTLLAFLSLHTSKQIIDLAAAA